MSIERNNRLAEIAKTSYPGWWPLIEPLVNEVNEKNFEIHQIKEKFGTLRFYFYPHEDELSNQVIMAERASGSVCSECGAAGKHAIPRTGWIPSICDSCYDARQERY